jgi:hypothetical protein
MSNHKLITDEGMLVGRNHWDVPVRVELRAYLNFSRRMDSQLRRLVARWAHAASPKARAESADRGQAGVPRRPK